MTAFLLPVTCGACGGALRLVQSVSSGTDATAVALCGSCRAEWVLAVQMRSMRPCKVAKHA